MEFRVQLIRENIKTFMRSKTKEEVEMMYEWIIRDLSKLKEELIERLDK